MYSYWTNVQFISQIDLPELENERSDLMRNFITDLLESRPGGACFCVIRYILVIAKSLFSILPLLFISTIQLQFFHSKLFFSKVAIYLLISTSSEMTVKDVYSSLNAWLRTEQNRPCHSTSFCNIYWNRLRVDVYPQRTFSQNVSCWCD